MAPTEILAEQHYRKLKNWLEPLGVKITWLTGSLKAKEKREAQELICNGQAQLVIGTHALIQEGVEFARLGFAVIDEQHRFGVKQRLRLQQKIDDVEVDCHQLMMSATPIPRTLAMTFYADLEVSVINELPPGRTPIVTKLVKNERRQSYENRPYGKANLELPALLYPKDHPYSWPVIGSMADLTAASRQDVADFFTQYYIPGNASLCIAGDIDLAQARKAVEKWFSDVPAGKTVLPPQPAAAVLTEEKRVVMEDKVQLPRLQMIWLSPANFQPGSAEMELLGSLLGGGKNSRLYKRLVYDLQIAQNVSAFQNSSKFSGEFYIAVTARPGIGLSQIEQIVQEEIDKITSESATDRELARVVNQYESRFLTQIERSGGFSGKANQLNEYFFYTGNPDYFNEDLQRYKSVDPADISAAARKYLRSNARIVMSIVPEGKKDLAATKK
jgi:hypothetical protein